MTENYSHEIPANSREAFLAELQTHPFGVGRGLRPSPCRSEVCLLGSSLSCQPGARLATTLLASLLNPVGAADRAPETDDCDGVLPGASADPMPGSDYSGYRPFGKSSKVVEPCDPSLVL